MAKSVIIDVREACREQKTGKGQWTYGFVTELLRRDVSLTLVTDTELPKEWQRASVKQFSQQGLRWHLSVLRWLRSCGSSTYISPTSYIVPAFAPKSIACITVVHDLIAFLGEPHDRKATLIERWMLPRAVRRSAHFCVTSDATKNDLLARYPHLDKEKVTSIFAGPVHLHPERAQPDGSTILCIATLCPRKNQLRLIQAFAALPEEFRHKHQLVLAGGRGWDDASIIEATKNTPGITWRGYVNAAEYESLLHTCTVFALPSLYEGFGMQILDALQRGIPVLTSDRGSLRELAQGAALIVHPESTDSIAKGLERLLTDAPLRVQLREKGMQRAEVYSWRRTVDLFLGTLSLPC